MSNVGKKYAESRKKVDSQMKYSFEEGLALVLDTAFAKFDESVDVAMKLGVDPRHADQMVRGSIVLPHGTGKSCRVLVFAKGDKEKEAQDAGAEFVGGDDLAQKILDEMFVFENLMDLDDRGIQLLLREIQSDSLILAMKGASEPLREKIFKNMSQRAAEMLREDLESRGPVRLSEVENEQKEILKIVRRLADEGQIVMGGAGGEQMI